MKQRCLNPNNSNFGHYGGRGIAVCERWETFEGFLDDMGERPDGHSLDRIDPDGDYTPGNCRWATQSTQNRNRRDTFRVNYRGKDYSVTDLAEKLGVNDFTLKQRVRYNWPEEHWGDAPDKNRYIIPKKRA